MAVDLHVKPGQVVPDTREYLAAVSPVYSRDVARIQSATRTERGREWM